MELKLSASEVHAYLSEVFPQTADDFVIEALEPMHARVRLAIQDHHLRPGGTVSGPAMFALADVGIYIAVLGMIGRVKLAVTTNANIDFMRKPAAGVDLVAECRLLKLGRVLAVGDVLLRSEGQEAPVARAALTYSIPPDASGA